VSLRVTTIVYGVDLVVQSTTQLL